MPANQLKNETSPYLLQHADNPVEWYPWGPEALERAERENKPILLSIGYSACHWCHVMAHESFEDQETAALMNDLFINIKVDREERPDLDKIYQTAHQLLVQRGGGWPLTVFLTPDKRIPFFAGTYFPNQPRHGLPSFQNVLNGISKFFLESKADIDRQSTSLLNAFKGMADRSNGGSVAITSQPLDLFMRQLQQTFDATNGGFNGAPKFPHPSNLELLLQRYAASVIAGHEDKHAWHMVDFSLEKMAHGGIFDHLGGGFCRYSVDGEWMIPHFEKMLYDNGQLLSLYSNAWLVSKNPLFERTVIETAEWVLREMQSPDGGYYSSLDADTEEGEGEFYVWNKEEVSDLLTADELAVFLIRFGMNGASNFEGKWHLHVSSEITQIAKQTGNAEDKVKTLLDDARIKLLEHRGTRVAPGRDEKILTSWNALMIKGMATAGRVFNKPEWVASAEQALDFIKAQLWKNERLLATSKDGQAHLAAYLDDYAFTIDAILALLEARWRDGDLDFATQLADCLLYHFEDEDTGGFYFTSHDHEELFYRPKPGYDEAVPSGNSIAAVVLGRLGHLLGESRYIEATEGVITAFWTELESVPHAHGSMLPALQEYLKPPKVVVLRGEPDNLSDWLNIAKRYYMPSTVLLAIPKDVNNLPIELTDKEVKGSISAYVCEGYKCGPVITSQDIFETAMARDGVGDKFGI